jgi:NAD(P)-dependent dehydrogenase (short-subunit alcohol dehydrogenase family)
MVTGATSGIGRATARALAQQGATVVAVGRSQERAEATVAALRQESGNRSIDYLLADLSVQAQVRRLAEAFQVRYPRLDVLINNAGGFFTKREESVDGIEMNWALHVLSPFLLTNLLQESLVASVPARVVNVSSDMHKFAKLNMDDLEMAHGYSGQKAYGQSKLALVLITYELARRLAGTGVVANAVHPGFVATGIGMGEGFLYKVAAPLIKLVAQSPEGGAQTSVYVAVSPEVEGVSGQYFAKEKPAQSAPVTYDQALAERLWAVCAQMTGLAPAQKSGKNVKNAK